MATITGTILDEEVPRARVALLLEHFSELGDDREPWRVMYPLKEVLLSSLRVKWQLGAAGIEKLFMPLTYQGSAQTFIDRLVVASQRHPDRSSRDGVR